MNTIPEHFHDRRSEGNTVLRQCQLVQLHLLYVIDAICKKHDIPYFLGGGTLLGAMRHNGFIPWDDDLDIGVMERDYKRLLKVLETDLPSDVVLQTPKTNPHTAIPFAKIRDKNSFYLEVRSDISTDDNSGIYLDIFPYEKFPDVRYSIQKFLILSCGSTWMRSIYFHNKARCGFARSVFFAGIGSFLTVLHFLVRAVIEILKCVSPCDSIFIKAECGYTHRYWREDIWPLTRHKFEDGEFPIPLHADRALTAQYGDWREIPPPEKRPHHARIIDPFHASS